MKYRDLVQFEPIETVIELRDASQTDKARKLVSTYVVSEAMARQLNDVIAPNLDFAALDAKGLFIVGNYGTGKSHLMAVVSALAENADLLNDLRDDSVRKAFEPIAGRYLVCRFEIGAVKTPLRDIVVRELERSLKHWGVDYRFPAVDTITSHKEHIENMLAQVDAKHPGMGVLLVIDELLDYLRALGEGAVSAFNFLRELGEASGNGRFRLIAGVQESLVSSPSFGFLADMVQRVSARHIEVWIKRGDLEYVVEERLLRKTPEQRQKIRDHLERFMPLFPAMSAKRDDFIRLYPVHPRYLQVFEDIDIAEKREVLRTLSQEVTKRLDEDVPTDQPGLISYDSYWRLIKETPSYLAHHDVGEVEDRAGIVAGKIATSFPKAVYKPAAERIVDGLAVFRLAVGGIRKGIGLSASDLRDDLALMLPGAPESDPEFLKTTIETVLKDISNTVGGQFISSNDANGQYYLDVDRVINYDGEVDKRVSYLEKTPEKLDLYYFDLLSRVLEMSDTTHVSGMKIWSYELEWPGHQVTRPGYVFFGSPNERSTAKPPRTFYLYFLAYFAPSAYEDAHRDDEVFFRLERPDEAAVTHLKRYAGAKELADSSSGEERAQYQRIAADHLKNATRSLTAGLLTQFDVTAGGTTSQLSAALGKVAVSRSSTSPRDIMDSVASSLLSPSFERRFPKYPRFPSLTAPVTEKSRAVNATEAIRYLSGSIKTAQGAAVLDGLGLTNESQAIDTSGSIYADRVRAALDVKPAGHVLNRSDLIAAVDGVELDPETYLEPEWLAVVLAAMAYQGDIEISAGARTIDAANLAVAAQLGAEELGRFKSVRRPTAPRVTELRLFMQMMGVNPALLEVAPDTALAELQAAIAKETAHTLSVLSKLGGAMLAGQPLWEGHELTGLQRQLSDYKDFLDRVSSINSTGKLKQFKASGDDIKRYQQASASLREAAGRLDRLTSIEALVSYLKEAEAILGPDDLWHKTASDALVDLQSALVSDQTLAAATSRLDSAKAAYAKRYLELHNRSRLDASSDDRKLAISRSNVVTRLKMLENTQILTGAAGDLRAQLASLVPCRQVDEVVLADSTKCRACYFSPAADPLGGANARLQLDRIEQELEELNEVWSRSLKSELTDPTAQKGLGLLGADRAAAVTAATEPDVIPAAEAIKDLNQVLAGLQPVLLSGAQILDALGRGGPATAEELSKRMNAFLEEKMAGKDSAKVRLVIE